MLCFMSKKRAILTTMKILHILPIEVDIYVMTVQEKFHKYLDKTQNLT